MSQYSDSDERKAEESEEVPQRPIEEIEKELAGDYVSSEINKDIKLARQLSLQGTPAFVIKNKLIFGYVGYDELLSRLKN